MQFIPVYLLLFIVLFVLLPQQNRFMYGVIQRQRKLRKKEMEGKLHMMPAEFVKEFLGKVCAVTQFGDAAGATGRITAVEDNWIRLEQKNAVRFINVDMIKDIHILPEKHQK